MNDRDLDEKTSMNKRKLLAMSNGRCCYCGQLMFNDVSTEHVIPQAVYKWTRDLLSEEERIALQDFLCSTDNLKLCHSDCNGSRGLGDSNKWVYPEHIKPYIDLYRRVISEILDKQKGRCYECYSSLTVNVAYPRRINSRFHRSVSNGKCLCKDCNDRDTGAYYRRSIWGLYVR